MQQDIPESNHPGPSLRSSHESANYLSSNGLTADADWPDDDFHSFGTNPPLASGHPGPTDSSAIESFVLSLLRSRLITLQASLLPPPNQMRLDPVSPLAKLTSPHKLKLSKLGTLDGSPRKPRGVLLCAPTSNPHLELRKSQPRTRGRSSLRSSAPLAKSTPPPATSGPLRTPESSPVRQAQDEMVEPFHPSILDGPNDEHRLYAYEVVAALFRYGSADTPNENRWDLERFIHPVFHQPPNQLELPRKPVKTPTVIDPQAFTVGSTAKAVHPTQLVGPLPYPLLGLSQVLPSKNVD